MRSIKERLFVLDDDTKVYPGHGPATTIGAEKKENPFLSEDERADRRFLSYLSVERGLSRNTIISYREDLGHYSDFLGRKHIETLSVTTKNEIINFMLEQKEKGIAANSVARRLAAIKMFYRFLVRERVLKSDPTSLIDSPKCGRRYQRRSL